MCCGCVHCCSLKPCVVAGTTRSDLGNLAHYAEFNNIVGLEERIQKEERLIRAEGAEKLHVRVRAPVRPVP